MHTPFGSLRHVTVIINHGLFFDFQMAGCAGRGFGFLTERNKNDPPLYGNLYVRGIPV